MADFNPDDKTRFVSLILKSTLLHGNYHKKVLTLSLERKHSMFVLCIYLLSIYYTTTSQQTQWHIELMELKPWCMAALALTVEGDTNSGPSSTALLISANSMPWWNFV